MENFYATKSGKALWAPLLRNDSLSCISFQLLVVSWSLFHPFFNVMSHWGLYVFISRSGESPFNSKSRHVSH